MFLIVFLIILALYSGIWVGLKYVFYEDSVNAPENMWYAEGEPELSVSQPFWFTAGVFPCFGAFRANDELKRLLPLYNLLHFASCSRYSLQFKVVLEEFLAFMVLCNYVIPISMYVTVGKLIFSVHIFKCFLWWLIFRLFVPQFKFS